MNPYLRLTVVGSRRKADLALPSDLPVEELFPEIASLLDEPPSVDSPAVLTTLIGVPVDIRASFADQGIVSGTVLRLLPLDSAPQPPDIADVTEAVADATSNHRARWGRTLTAIALGGAIAVAAAVTALSLPFAASVSAGVLAAVFVLGAVGGGIVARHPGSSRPSAVAGLFALGVGVALPLGIGVADSLGIGGRGAAAPALGLAWALIWICAAIVFGIGAGRRSVLVGAVIAIVTCAIALATVAWPAAATTIVAFAAVIAAGMIGFAPSFALSAAGVGRFDDAAAAAETVRRSEVAPAIAAAFSMQTAIALALTTPLAVSVLVLSRGNAWQQGLAAALTVFVLTRARLFPLAVARFALLLTAALPAAFWLWTSDALPAVWRAAIGATICVVLLLSAVLSFPAATQARLRRLLGVFETLSVIAMVPLLLGILGLFGELLGAFS